MGLKGKKKKKNLFELLVRVSEPSAGGSVSRITLLQHLILWQKKETVHADNKYLTSALNREIVEV